MYVSQKSSCWVYTFSVFLRPGLAAFKNVKRSHPLFMASFIIQAGPEKTEFNLSLSYENELLPDLKETTGEFLPFFSKSEQSETFVLIHVGEIEENREA